MALTYVFDYKTGQLSRELLRAHHEDVEMSVAVLYVHLHECLRQKSRVEHFASHLIDQRGVRLGSLVVIPAVTETDM